MALAANSITSIINLIGDLDTYADELDGDGWHNAANGCRAAITEIERLRAQRDALLAALKQSLNALKGASGPWTLRKKAIEACEDALKLAEGK